MRHFFLRRPQIAPGVLKKRTRAECEAHFRTKTYNGFTLTKAIRPGWELPIMLTEGYRHETVPDSSKHPALSVLVAAVSAEKIMNVFMGLVERLAQGSKYLEVVLIPHHRPQD